MGIWIIWLIVAVVLGVAENIALQFGAFAITAAAGLGIARPFAMRHLKQPPPLRTGTAALVGRSGYVLDEVTARSGRVRIGGEEWSARAYDETLTIPEGSAVDVMQIEGATALVYPRD
jgi:membrane protein implicated in regulation of membrane protease activity